jgi:hypothetical protein
MPIALSGSRTAIEGAAKNARSEKRNPYLRVPDGYGSAGGSGSLKGGVGTRMEMSSAEAGALQSECRFQRNIDLLQQAVRKFADRLKNILLTDGDEIAALDDGHTM